jgi:hypothetical protein
VSHENDVIHPFFADFKLTEGMEPKKMFRDLTVELNKTFSVKNHDGAIVLDGLNQDFSLLELITFFFEELYYTATNKTEDATPEETPAPGLIS